MNFAEVEEWVRANLPPAPARILEVGAGEGELAASLTASGYDVTAIDPKSNAPNVVPVALANFTADEPFDAAAAVVSLHHVEPLGESVQRLADLLRPGALLLVDEFDVWALDERAAAWWLEQCGDAETESPHELIEKMQARVHAVAFLRSALEPSFVLGAALPGTYLYRWKLGESFRAEEERLIAAAELPRTGVRFTARRRPRQALPRSSASATPPAPFTKTP